MAEERAGRSRRGRITVEIAVALVMTLLGLGLVGIPLLRERKPEEELAYDEYEDPELDRLLSRKETAVEAIRELEFDHAVGGLSDEDYADLKEKYERKAISVLKNLKEMEEADANGRSQMESGRTTKAARAKHGERQRVLAFACPDCGSLCGDEDRFCASCGAEQGVYEDGGFTCPECGKPYEEGDAYCASCGVDLVLSEEEFAADGFANEKIEKTVRPENTTSNTKPKRQARRSSRGKKAAGNDSKDA